MVSDLFLNCFMLSKEGKNYVRITHIILLVLNATWKRTTQRLIQLNNLKVISSLIQLYLERSRVDDHEALDFD